MGIIIHQYPFDCKAFYPVEMVLEMAKIPNVKALKCGIRQMAVYERDVGILRKKAPKLTILSCMDEYLVSSLYIGVDGALVGFGGLIPELITEVWKAVQANDFVKTRKLQSKIFPLAQAVYQIGQPSGEAHATAQRGLAPEGDLQLFSDETSGHAHQRPGKEGDHPGLKGSGIEMIERGRAGARFPRP